MTRDELLEVLLALVVPRCGRCARPATKAEREAGPNQMAPGRYLCDVHVVGAPGRWQDLPGAAAIREATQRTQGDGHGE